MRVLLIILRASVHGQTNGVTEQLDVLLVRLPSLPLNAFRFGVEMCFIRADTKYMCVCEPMVE